VVQEQWCDGRRGNSREKIIFENWKPYETDDLGEPKREAECEYEFEY